MRANLDLTGGLILAERVAFAAGVASGLDRPTGSWPTPRSEAADEA